MLRIGRVHQGIIEVATGQWSGVQAGVWGEMHIFVDGCISPTVEMNLMRPYNKPSRGKLEKHCKSHYFICSIITLEGDSLFSLGFRVSVSAYTL